MAEIDFGMEVYLVVARLCQNAIDQDHEYNAKNEEIYVHNENCMLIAIVKRKKNFRFIV